MEQFIKISTDFSPTPSARNSGDGKKSGAEFYDTLLRSKYESAVKLNTMLVIDLDGTAGYATSFLNEAFHRLSVDFGAEKVLQRITIISFEEPYLIDEIKDYVLEANTAV